VAVQGVVVLMQDMDSWTSTQSRRPSLQWRLWRLRDGKLKWLGFVTHPLFRTLRNTYSLDVVASLWSYISVGHFINGRIV